ncbi:MAG: exodeoxyribonuclease VII small subunit [Rhodothalassiaceae bacterium]
MSELKAVDQLSFEEAMAELEGLVAKLEAGDVPLDQSIALYERGAALRQFCEHKLREAEERIEKLTVRNGAVTGRTPLDPA